MLRRKLYDFLIVALLTAMILTILEYSYTPLGIFYNIKWFLELYFFILVFATPLIFVVGVPVSLLSDFVTSLLTGKFRSFIALIIHVGFGYFFGFNLVSMFEGPGFLWATLIAAFIFWLVDEVLRNKMKTKNIVPVHYQM